MTPDFLSHYYEAAHGPFRNLSHLPAEEAEEILDAVRQAGDVFAAKRAADYLTVRRELEVVVRERFIAIGGRPRLARPHYMLLGACPWLLEWYADGRELRIPLHAFDPNSVSFTYGDTFPAMRLRDGMPHRGRVYRMEELTDLVSLYGLPQQWNADGAHGPDRYIEAQIWNDAPLRPHMDGTLRPDAPWRP